MAAFLVVLLVVVGVVVLLMRAGAAAGNGGSVSTPRQPRLRPQHPRRVVAPDDDPEFLRELDRRRSRGEDPSA